MKNEIKTFKKILMLNYEFPPLGGGASPVSYEIAKGYVQLGHKVDVVTMGYKDLPEFEIKEGINIYRVKCLRSKKEICHPWEQYSYILSAKKFLKQHMKTHAYDINHTHFIIPTGLLSIWLKKKYNLPYIVTSHGSDVLGYNNKRAFKYIYPLVKGKWKKIVKEAKIVTTPSQFLQDKIKAITTQGNFIVIPNGIDFSKFKPMKKENKILVVARLFENKGVQDIIKALSNEELKNKLIENSWKVDIVGEGPYRKELESLVKENNLQNLVIFHGWIDNNSNEMKDFYGKAKIFVSASWFESFGITLLEAISAGCYPLVSDIDGHKEVISDKKYIFKKGDTNDLMNNLSRLLNEDIKPIKLNGRFLWNNIYKEFEEVIR